MIQAQAVNVFRPRVAIDNAKVNGARLTPQPLFTDDDDYEPGFRGESAELKRKRAEAIAYLGRKWILHPQYNGKHSCYN